MENFCLYRRIEGDHISSGDHAKLKGALDRWATKKYPIRCCKSGEVVEVQSKKGLNEKGQIECE
jgi:hypothetical protein